MLSAGGCLVISGGGGGNVTRGIPIKLSSFRGFSFGESVHTFSASCAGPISARRGTAGSPGDSSWRGTSFFGRSRGRKPRWFLTIF